MNQTEDFTAAYLADLTERLATRAVALGGRLARKLRRPAKLFERFIRRQEAVVASMRTLVHPDEHYDIRKLFVKPTLLVSGNDSKAADLAWMQSLKRGLLITGPAGTGKTLLLRSLVLESLERGGALPIYLELRTLNDSPSDTSLLQAIYALLAESNLDLTLAEIVNLFDVGEALLFADGLDEVSEERRPAVLRQLRNLQDGDPEFERPKESKRRAACRAIVTSRDELGFLVEGYSRVKISPLSLEQAILLVERLPVEPIVVSAVVAALRTGLFAERRSFADNPLLLTILVLTQAVAGSVPSREAEFYDVAYSALFRRHDALTKPGFSRPRRTHLDGSQFAAVFAYFSMWSLGRRQFEFTEQRAMDLASLSLGELRWTDVSAEGYIDDCVRAVCLLMEDGERLVFIHRSFQEYFAARFLWLHAAGHRREQLLRSVAETAGRDKVIHLLNEMAPEVVQGNLLVPFLGELRSAGALSERPRYSHVEALCRFCDLQKAASGWQGNQELRRYLGIVAFLIGTGRLHPGIAGALLPNPPHPSSLREGRLIVPGLGGDDYDRELLEFLANSTPAFSFEVLRDLNSLERELCLREKGRDDFLRQMWPRSD